MMLRQVKFLRELIANEPSHRAIGETAEFFSRAEGIGTIQGARVAYAPRDFVAARNLLTSRGFETAAAGQLVPRSQVQPGESEKWGSLRVSEGMVAVVPLGLAGLQIPVGSMLCTDVRKALALPYEVLVFCENLEPMMLLQTYRWLAGFLKGRPAMALFRGAPGGESRTDAARYFRADAAHELLRLDHRPVLALFDFDPKGLSMAASVPRREALCLPPWPSLEAAVKAHRRKDLYFGNVVEVRQHLMAQPKGSDIGRAWGLMNTLELGLDQEHFPVE